MSFANFKSKKTDLAALTAKVAEYAEGGKNKYKDERFWAPTVDKAKNGSAKIRYLPAPEGEDLYWSKYSEHNFSTDSGNYFVELCPSTIGKECPVCVANKPLWKLKDEGDKDAEKLVSARKKKVHFISNILVIKDPANPENDGKLFLFKYGVKIFDKISAKLKPSDDEDEPVNVFNFWEGADFNIVIKNVGGYNNYDDSNFRPKTSALYNGDDEKLEKLYNSLYPLIPFTAPEKFKSYDELQKKFLEVTTGPSKVRKKAEELFETKPSVESKKAPETKSRKKEEEKPAWEEENVGSEDVDDPDFYDNLAKLADE